MAKKLVGQVTPEEKNEILTLFERRNGLNELAKILTAIFLLLILPPSMLMVTSPRLPLVRPSIA